MDEDSIIALRRGGYLHDLGKIAVPDEILKKGSDLTPEEWKIMKLHPVTGENICKPLKSLRLVLPIIRHHHEHPDGSGYPDGLTGRRNPAAAADSAGGGRLRRPAHRQRPYKPAIGHDQSAHTMREKARQGLLDGDLVNEFFGMLLEQRVVA